MKVNIRMIKGVVLGYLNGVLAIFTKENTFRILGMVMEKCIGWIHLIIKGIYFIENKVCK